MESKKRKIVHKSNELSAFEIIYPRNIYPDARLSCTNTLATAKILIVARMFNINEQLEKDIADIKSTLMA